VALLRRWVRILEARKYELALAALQEVGRSRTEALGESDEVLDRVAYYCSEIERSNGYPTALNRGFPNETTVSVLRPLGLRTGPGSAAPGLSMLRQHRS
jgi:1-pyrroline-5-carboxylate dehydrogenase